MKAKIVWIKKRYFCNGKMHDIMTFGWTIQEKEPVYDRELHDEYILIPVEDD